MRHNWKHVNQGTEGMFNYGKRRCENCGAVQTKEAEYSWMVITGYQWFPLVGICKQDKK